MISQLSPQERLEKSGRLFTSGMQLTEIAVRRRHPGLQGLELQLAVFRILYQSTLTDRFVNDIERRARGR